MPDIKVYLIEIGYIYDSNLAETITSSDGSFSIETNLLVAETSKISVRIEYSYSSKFFIENDLKTVRSENFIVPMDVIKGRSLNFNEIHLNPSHCRAFILFRQCFLDYEKETEQTHPASMIHIITDSLMTAGLPYASTDTVRIPKDTKLDLDIAMHEFAHTIRHSLDGSFLHFLLDVVQYSYAQNHWCDKKTNEGFAFNEGFAELWQSKDECNKVNPSRGYDHEGYVVRRLRDLANRCHKGKWKKPFVVVLKENPGVIHSFTDFIKFHELKFSCPV